MKYVLKTRNVLMIISLLFIPGMFLSNCEKVIFPAMGEGELDTDIPLENHRYNLRTSATDSVIEVKFINRSDENLYYKAGPMPSATVQKLEGNRWKDLGIWYRIVTGGPIIRVTLKPGEMMSLPELDLRNSIHSSGYYRIHFSVYREADYEELIPETDRVSDPFVVIL
ncbi:MAG: hypothetical protein JJU13_00580 [Balneolaceae bacterium]|nr:hypothetical protein [Balneolaceae bacterium]